MDTSRPKKAASWVMGLGIWGSIYRVGEVDTGRARGWRWFQSLGVGQAGLNHLVVEARWLFGGGSEIPAVYEGLSEMDPPGEFGWFAAR